MRRVLGYRRTVQLELFRPPPPGPTWDQIPPAAKQKVITLLARMLREHRTPPPAAERREMRHE